METKVSDLFAELDRGPAAAESVVVSSSSKAEASPHAALPPVQVVKRKREQSVEQRREATLKTIEADLLRNSMEVVGDSLRFREIDPGQIDPPSEWVEELESAHPGKGLELANQRLRCANAGWMNKKDSPVAVQVAQALAIGIIRSRSAEKSGPRTLNVQVVQMSAPLPDFPRLRLEKSEK